MTTILNRASLFKNCSALMLSCVVVSASSTSTAQTSCSTARECHQLGEYQYKKGSRASLKKAVDYYEQACDAQWGPSCDRLAMLALDGRTSDVQDTATAFYYHRRSCQATNPERCLALADLYQNGAFGAIELDRARQLARDAADAREHQCHLGWFAGCLELGLMLHNGEWFEPEPRAARRYLKQACTKGIARACYNFGLVLRSEGDKNDADTYVERACQMGYARGCAEDSAIPMRPRTSCDLDEEGAPPLCRLRGSVDVPQITTVHHARSLQARIERNLCREGDPGACLRLGDLYRFGIGLAKDSDAAETMYKAAHVLYEQGCHEGAANDCHALYTIYNQGKYASKDLDRAQGYLSAEMRLYQRQCVAEEADGCYHLARLLFADPRSVLATALSYLETACDQDHPQACARLAGVYRKKRRPEYDPDKALELYQRACTLGSMPACRTAIRLYLKAGQARKARPLQSVLVNHYRAGCNADKVSSCLKLREHLLATSKPDASEPQQLLERVFVGLEHQCNAQKSGASCTQLAKLFRNPATPVSTHQKSQVFGLYQRACMLGRTFSASQGQACTIAGLMSEHGTEGATQNTQTAHVLFARACMAGIAKACVWVADEDPQELRRAKALLQRSCIYSNDGCVELELLYRSTDLARSEAMPERDMGTVVSKLKKSCRRRKTKACVQLGRMYRDGLGVHDDHEASERYFHRALRLVQRACKRRGACEGRLELCSLGVEAACAQHIN